MSAARPRVRLARAVHGRKTVARDPDFELGLAKHLRRSLSREGLIELYARFALAEAPFDVIMRRTLLRALCKRFGHGVSVGIGFGFKHPETFEIGDGVFLGASAYLQGRFDGRCVIGAHSWLGPQSYLDARDLIVGEYVGWGPGAKVVGSEHTGKPLASPIIRTELLIKAVRIGDWADIGANCVVLPGVAIGKGAVIGAGAVVTRDVAPFTVAAGVPAKVLRARGQ